MGRNINREDIKIINQTLRNPGLGPEASPSLLREDKSYTLENYTY